MMPPPSEPAPAESVPAEPASRGYTLPVWVAAAARAACGRLRGELLAPQECPAVELELLEPPGRQAVPVEAAALLEEGWALGQARCRSGPGLDLTQGLRVWVLARWEPAAQAVAGVGERFGAGSGASEAASGAANEATPASGEAWLQLEPGEGVGVHAASGEACLSDYARRLLVTNLRPLRPDGLRLRLRVVLPAGRALAERTSNAAFGVVEGLALIGTRAEPQASADPQQLERTLATLAARLAAPQGTPQAPLGAPEAERPLILVLGENGLDLAPRLGLPAAALLKVGNWVGPVLVAAGQAGVRRLLLFGYQGKLLKLAGGIFHTHHHLADGRAEILTALAALEGLSGAPLQALHDAATVEAALQELERGDPALAERLRARIAAAVEARSRRYLARHGVESLAVGAALFDRSRRLTTAGPLGAELLEAWIRPQT